MNNTLLDNSEKFLMKDILQQFIGSGKYNHICIATGYWDLPGTKLVYEQLKSFLEGGGRLDILIGQEPQLRSYQTHLPETDEESFPDFYLERDINLLTDDYRPTAELIQKFCNVHKYEHLVSENQFSDPKEESEDHDNSQIQIRVYGQKDSIHKQFLHAKCYIFLGPGEADGIIGSSNFTEKGLEDNAELNYLETQNSIVTAPLTEYSNSKSHKVWFEEKWKESEPWNGKFLKILSSAPVGKPKPEPEKPEEDAITPLTPYELYIKLLQTKFADLVDKNLGQRIESYLPIHYDIYEYQIDAVKQCFSTMKEHGGFMLADVVGLGKTIVGTLVIKHFLQFPDEDGRNRQVLIITPPAIQTAWKETIEEFDKDKDIKIADAVTYITTGSIGKLVDNYDIDDEATQDDDLYDSGSFNEELSLQDFGLILIDESHKFRNSETAMYRKLDELISQIGADTGNYPYIGLLSATPQNNRPRDLQNQIYLFERNHTDSTLKKAKGGNLESFFTDVNREYSELIRTNPDEPITPEERQKRLLDISQRIRDCVLADIMVRRTRTDVEKYYNEDMKKQGIIFPRIKGPIELEYKMSSRLAKLFYDTMNCISPTENFAFNNSDYLCYYRYRAIQFLSNSENKDKYNARGSLNADKLAEQLASIMQINLVKRLESSFTAFNQSLQNLRKYTQNMIDMWDNNTIFICPNINVNAELDLEAKKKKHGTYTFDKCIDDIRRKIKKLNDEGRNDDQSNMEYTRDDFNPAYITLLKLDLELITQLCDRWGKEKSDPKRFEFMQKFKSVLMNPETNHPQKLVIFSEAIDTVEDIKAAIGEVDEDINVLVVTASERKDLEPVIKENFDANYKGTWKDDYQILVTTDVLAEGINLHRANCILNYDTPWNSTKLMQRIGRVNRIGSKEPFVYVYNFMPSAQGDAAIGLVKKAHTKIQSFHTLFGEDSQIFSTDEEVSHYDLNTEVNGEESPLEKYVYELKQFKLQNPKRYNYILQAEDEREMAVPNDNACCYFLVRSPRMNGMFVRVKPGEEEGEVISMYDMLELCKPTENANKTALPTEWDDYKSEAQRVVTAELASVRFRHSNNKKAVEAKEIIINLKKTQAMSASSKKLLNSADALIRKGNLDIVKHILRIGKAVKEQKMLIPYTQEEFDNYLRNAIEKIVERVQLKNGKSEVYIGFYL